MKIPNFEETIKTYDRYYRKMDKEDSSFNNDLAIEGRKRIVQLNKVLNILHVLNLEIDKFHKKAFNGDMIKAKKEEVINYHKSIDDIELYADVFYWIAFRLLVILDNLPQLKGIKNSCKGITLTRNYLIEHTEVYLQGFAVGSGGPVVKAVRYEDQKDVFPANPLYQDAHELKTNLEKMLKKAIS